MLARYSFLIPVFLLLICGQEGLSQVQVPDSVQVRWSGELPEGMSADTIVPCSQPCLTPTTAAGPILREALLNGYPGAGIDSVIRTSPHPVLWLSSGPRTGSTIVLGPGKEISLHSVPTLLDRTVRHLANEGHPFATARLAGLRYEAGAYHARLQVDKGPAYLFEGFSQEGLTLLADDYLEALSGLREGQPFNDSLLAALPERLEREAGIRLETSPLVTFGDSTFRISLSPRRVRANELWAMAGLSSDPEANPPFRLTGEARARLSHLLRHGDVLGFDWRGNGNGSQDLRLDLEYPYLLGWPLGLDADFLLRRIDTSFLQRQFSGGVAYLPAPGRRLGWRASIWDGDRLSQGDTRVSRRMTGLSIRLGHTAGPADPRRGFRLDASIQSGYSTTSGESSVIRKTRGQLDLKAHLLVPLGRSMAFRFGLISEALFGQGIGELEYYRPGGYRDLRGYGEQAFALPGYGVISAEWRWLPDASSRIGLFWDLAYLHLPESPGYYQALGISAGIGTGAGLLIIQYAVPKPDGEAFQLRQGKLHLGIEASF